MRGGGVHTDGDRNKTSSKMSHSISNGHLRERHTRGEKGGAVRDADIGKAGPVLFEIN